MLNSQEITPDRGAAIHTRVIQFGRGQSVDGVLQWFEVSGIEKLSDISEGVQWLDLTSGAQLIVLYPDPADQFAPLIAREDNWDKLDELADSLQSLLDNYRMHRRCVTLINADAALANPTDLELQIQRRLGVQLEATAAGNGLSYPAESLIPRIVGTAILRSHKRMGTLLTELQASSLPLSLPEVIEPEAIINAWKKVNASSAHQTRSLEAENELLKLQLNQAAEELEAQHQDFLKSVTKDSAGNREALRQKDHYLKLKETELQTLSLQLRSVRDDLRAVRESKSWKITAPLRKGLSLITGAGESGSVP